METSDRVQHAVTSLRGRDAQNGGPDQRRADGLLVMLPGSCMQLVRAANRVAQSSTCGFFCENEAPLVFSERRGL